MIGCMSAYAAVTVQWCCLFQCMSTMVDITCMHAPGRCGPVQIEAGKALDVVRREVDLVELVSDVHCIIDAMVGRIGEVGVCSIGHGETQRSLKEH